ncbi:MAG TPA: polysaccharide biosynthesis/export family protein [Flavobacterium sp.]|nr:polysaccharide biosynthesis/export family protein [Flavobacterium sp.]
MNKSMLLLLVLAGLIFTSCVPQKDLIYLQKKDKTDTINAINPIVSKPYRLQTNDVVMITIKALDPKLVEIFKPSAQAEQSKTDVGLYFDGFTVDDHGNIRVPVLGEINVIGYTLEEVRVKVEKKLLEEYFNKEANIFVTVKLSGLHYTINGEINAPGTRVLYQERVNVMEAIANSGDITMVGDRKHVVIMRQFPQGTEMHEIDLTDAKVMESPYYYIQSNDYIYIKPLKQKSWGTGRTGIESLGTILSVLTLVTTTLLLIQK